MVTETRVSNHAPALMHSCRTPTQRRNYRRRSLEHGRRIGRLLLSMLNRTDGQYSRCQLLSRRTSLRVAAIDSGFSGNSSLFELKVPSQQMCHDHLDSGFDRSPSEIVSLKDVANASSCESHAKFVISLHTALDRDVFVMRCDAPAFIPQHELVLRHFDVSKPPSARKLMEPGRKCVRREDSLPPTQVSETLPSIPKTDDIDVSIAPSLQVQGSSSSTEDTLQEENRRCLLDARMWDVPTLRTLSLEERKRLRNELVDVARVRWPPLVKSRQRKLLKKVLDDLHTWGGSRLSGRDLHDLWRLVYSSASEIAVSLDAADG